MRFSEFTTVTKADILSQYGTSVSGLTLEESETRLRKYGPNEIQTQTIHWWNILIRQLKSPFLYLLIVAAIFSFVLKGQVIDGVMILLFVAINISLGFYQEFKSEQTLKLLRQYIFPKTRVRRNGIENAVKTKSIVAGDIILLEPGDIVPSDIRLLEAKGLLLDESILTGESAPSSKTSKELETAASEIYMAKNICFSATTVVSGMGVGVCLGTGSNTSFGEIAKLATETYHKSNFEVEIGIFSKFILKTIIITIIGVFLVNLFLKSGRVDPAYLAIFSIALAVSVIPEALPVVTTFSLSRGALKLAENKVVVKRLSSIEDLGEIQILCTDKTGTLTENKLRIEDVNSTNKRKTILSALLCSAFLAKGKKPTDAFEMALFENTKDEEKQEIGKVKILDQIPFDPERKRVTTLAEIEGEHCVIVRGAHEQVFALCKNLKAQEIEKLTGWISKKGENGFRAIAVAQRKIKNFRGEELGHLEKNLELIGIISFHDPIKKSTKSSIKNAHALGVRVIILTGDSREVAGTVANEIGLGKNTITGEEFEALPPEEQEKILQNTNVFARMSPSQKYKTIERLQKQNFNVGFLGEGINDAPALKIANVGLVVHGASDIAREAADIVLLNKSLDTIIGGIQNGREVFVNTTKYITATLSSNFGNFFAIAISSFLIDFLPMLPLQILLVNLLSDFPMISIATDNVDKNELKKPRRSDVKSIIVISTILGFISTCFDFLFFGIFFRISAGALQTNWFMGSILTELVFLFSIRSKRLFFRSARPSTPILILTATAFLATISIPFTQFGQKVFEFSKPTPVYLFTTLGIVAVYFAATETAKILYFKFTEHGLATKQRI